MSNVMEHFPSNGDKGICIMEAKMSLDLVEWFRGNKEHLENIILKYGGVLIRNFAINSVSEFNQFAQNVCPNLLNYIYRSTPRTLLGGKIYTATEYPADQYIPLHNENSYTDSWPQKIIFFCAIPAKEGGETILADSRKVNDRINQDIKEKFKRYGVLYVRNYRPGVDLSWQEVFQTSKKDEVEKYCKEHSIHYSWNDSGSELTTKQACQATLTHPITKEEVWFNQAHLFHISSLDKEIEKSLLTEFGEKGIPRNAFYGDGTLIEEDVIAHIRQIYNDEVICFPWRKGDLMILDNILMAHGRRSFSGERKIVVAMG